MIELMSKPVFWSYNIPISNPQGKTVGVCGDSNSDNFGGVLSWWNWLAANSTLGDIIKYARSGRTLVTTQDLIGVQPQVVEAYGKDIIIVDAGTNDWYFNIPIGTVNDGFTTIKGATKAIIDLVNANSPNSILIFISPATRTANRQLEIVEDHPINDIGLTIYDIGKAIGEVCKEEGVRHLRIYERPPLVFSNGINIFLDGLHLNQYGQDEKGKQVKDFIYA